MVTMSSFGKFQSGSNTELFQEIRTIHASSLHSEIAVRIPDKPKNAIHSRRIGVGSDMADNKNSRHKNSTRTHRMVGNSGRVER